MWMARLEKGWVGDWLGVVQARGCFNEGRAKGHREDRLMLGDNQELDWQGSATDGLKEVRKMEKYKVAPRFLPK